LRLDLTSALPAADVILFGASDATPYVVGQTSHAAKAPDFIRRALRHYESDLTRWDFDQEAELLPPAKAAHDHREVGVRQGLAPLGWPTLDLAFLRAVFDEICGEI
jgi:hypothetical protein